MRIRKPFYYNKFAFSAIVVIAVFSFGCGGRAEEPSGISKAKYPNPPTAININTASAEELQKIPYIGEKLANRIVDHRVNNGPFRRPEDLILISGISDSRFRKIRDLVRID